MKKILLFLVFLCSMLNVFGQCPPNPIVLSSQIDVDNFTINYPNCTELTSSLTISGSDIIDLSALSVITKLGTDLEIDNNSLLQNLNGFENVILMGVLSGITIKITDNPQLTSINALSSMVAPFNTNYTLDINISNNPLLLSLDGMKEVYGFVDTFNIENNDSLSSLIGLEKITGAENFYVRDNNNLINFSGTESFVNAGKFIVENNSNLQNIESTYINNVLNEFRINNNPLITNIDAFSPFASYSNCNGLVEITNNASLSICDSDYLCNVIPCSSSIVTILNNAPGCNDEIEATDNCPTCPTEEVYLTTQAEVDAFASLYPNCTHFDFDIFIEGNDISDISGMSQIETMRDRLYVRNNPLLTSLHGLENLYHVIQSVYIINNPLLTNLEGLTGLYDSSIYISDNIGLESLNGIDSAYFFNSILIYNNDNLTNVEAINNVSVLPSTVRFTNNDLLSNCSIETLCLMMEQEFFDITISNNNDGCEELSDVYEDCIGCPYTNVVLNSQAEVDAFSINFPTCNTILEHLLIEGNDIVDLTPLQNISYLGRNLTIQNNSQLLSLEGLNNLSTADQIRIDSNPLLNDVSALSNIESSFSIEIMDNPSLEEITGWENFIETLNLNISYNSGLVSLIGLQNLNVTESVFISYNESLTNLNGLEGLTTPLSISLRNNISLTDITAFSNIQSINAGISISQNDVLTNINGLEGIQNSGVIWIKNNPSLLNLDGLSGLTNSNSGSILEIEIEFNDSLNDISGLAFLNPNSIAEVRITYNDNLSECSILSLCTAIANGEENMFFNFNETGCNSFEEVETNCSNTLNTVNGTILFDFNIDGCDSNDYPVENITVRAINDISQTISTSTNNDGEYQLLIPEGDFLIEIVAESMPLNFVSNPENVQVVFTGGGNQEVVDFCLTATDVFNDLKITLIPLNQARPGFDAEYKLVYENIGTTVLSGDVTLEFDNTKQTYLNAIPSEESISGNIITWNYTNLLPFESRSIVLNFNNLPPPINESGDVLAFYASINPIAGDANELDNVYQFNQVIVNSQDPNDKQVLQGSEIFEEEVGKYLDYIVRFQNVGTASAINVRVDDVLSDKLNWSTFRPISSSHEYRIEIINENFISFIYEEINLPAEQDDPEGSNGFVAFQIKSNTDLVVGDIIENTASIYFDFNDAIITNTVTTEVVEPLGVYELNLASVIQLIPNPVSEVLRISLSENISFNQATIYSVLGEKLMVTSEKSIDFSNLSEGLYFVEIFTEQGTISKKIIKE